MATNPLLDPGRAPLVEVALTVQFARLHSLSGAHIGRFWDEFLAAEFPSVEQHPLVDTAIELERAPVLPRGQIRFSSEPRAPRLFFISEDDKFLVQMQDDRISLNWRLGEDGYDYPRFESLHARFAEYVEKLRGFVAREKLGEITPNQCELLYANHVLYRASALPHKHIGLLVNPWAETYTELAGAALEDVRIHVRHVLERDGRFVGRLHVNVEPAYLIKDNTPIYKIELTGRGQPRDSSIDVTLETLTYFHNVLLAAFRELLSDTIQGEWLKGEK